MTSEPVLIPRGKAGRVYVPRWIFDSPVWRDASVEMRACFVEMPGSMTASTMAR